MTTTARTWLGAAAGTALLALCSGFTTPSGHAVVARRSIEAMIPIRGGVFTMGASPEMQAAALELCRDEIGARHAHSCARELVATEGPMRRVWLAGFVVDRVEVTVAAYRACMQAGVCPPGPLVATSDERLLAPELPVTSVTWNEADTYCRWRGGRLPSEAEWERAARGADGRAWPWGNVPRPRAFNHGRFAQPDDAGGNPVALIRGDDSDGAALPAPVGSFRDGATPEGVLDLAGNVMEWTSDVYREEPPQATATVNPRGPQAGALRVLRGGSWRQPTFFARTTFRDNAAPDTRSAEIGFRCVR